MTSRFYIMERMGPNKRLCICFVEFARWQHGRRSCCPLYAWGLFRLRDLKCLFLLKTCISLYVYDFLVLRSVVCGPIMSRRMWSAIDENAIIDFTSHFSIKQHNKLQSETADFAPSAATWWTGQNIRVVFVSLHYEKSWRHPQNRKYITYSIVVRGGPNNVHSR